jgi:hypothetical protein
MGMNDILSGNSHSQLPANIYYFSAAVVASRSEVNKTILPGANTQFGIPGLYHKNFLINLVPYFGQLLANQV